jgi:hypothetical protein
LLCLHSVQDAFPVSCLKSLDEYETAILSIVLYGCNSFSFALFANIVENELLVYKKNKATKTGEIRKRKSL